MSEPARGNYIENKNYASKKKIHTAAGIRDHQYGNKFAAAKMVIEIDPNTITHLGLTSAQKI